MRPTRSLWLCLLVSIAACGGDAAGPGETEKPDPGPGPFFSVVPLRIETIARISALGANNKILPTAHTYWETCDFWIGPRLDMPCHMERQPLLAPGGGTVRDVDASADGFLMVEGPRGLIWTFGHVTPASGLVRGSTVQAGDTIATMYYEHGFDFGVIHYGEQHQFIVPERYSDHALHGQHPIAQFPPALRAELATRMLHDGPGYGRLSYDSIGTVSGTWVTEGTGPIYITADEDPLLLWFGRWTEKPSLRIVTFGTTWPGMENQLLVADSSAPSWEDIRVGDGRVAIRLWNMSTDLEPNTDWPAGTLLLELLSDDSLRIEWFATHGAVADFTGAARRFER